MSKTFLDNFMAFEVSEIGITGCNRKLIVASPERDVLAIKLGVNKLTNLVVDIDLRRDPARAEVFYLKGRFWASVIQECVICLGLVRVDIEEDFEAQFVPDTLSKIKEDVFSHTDPDHPETYSNDFLEFGKLVQDQLSLAIESYPRHELARESDQCIMIEDKNHSSDELSWFPFKNLDKLLNKK